MKTSMNMAILLLLGGGHLAAETPAQDSLAAQSNTAKPAYTITDNLLDPFTKEKDLKIRIHLLDEFVSEHPGSPLLVYVYQMYCATYWDLKDFSKVMAYSDKLLASKEKLHVVVRSQALFAWLNAYNRVASTDPGLALEAKQKAMDGVRSLPEIKKPEGLDDHIFETQKRVAAIYFQATAGAASLVLKDYPAAAESLGAILALASAERAAKTPN